MQNSHKNLGQGKAICVRRRKEKSKADCSVGAGVDDGFTVVLVWIRSVVAIGKERSKRQVGYSVKCIGMQVRSEVSSANAVG